MALTALPLSGEVAYSDQGDLGEGPVGRTDDGLIMALVVGLLAYWLWPGATAAEYITIYRRICVPPDPVAAANNFATYYDCSRMKGSSVYAAPLQFRASFEKQQVFKLDVFGVMKLENCVVADSENWKCQSSGKFRSNLMIDGNYSSDEPMPSEQLSWLSYKTVRMAGWFR